ncbi:MAG: LytTR family DNA-binding domain-containing protein [Pseudomonadota bacterium]
MRKRGAAYANGAQNATKPGILRGFTLYEARMGSQFRIMTTASAPPEVRTSTTRTPKTLARKIVIDLTIMTAIGVILAFIGPFGSFEEPLTYRLLSWVSFAWIGYAIYSPMGPLADRVCAALDLPRAPVWVVAAAISSLPMTAIVHIMGYLPGPVPWPSVERFFTSYPYVFIIGGGVTALFYFMEHRGRTAAPSPQTAQTVSAAPPSAEPPEPLQSNPLLDALPAALGSDVIALEMEDHYVRVHTALGSELVLMRLRDAMAHVTDIEGRQTHRSWWVARGAVEGVVREGRNVRLVLARGIEAPVSRAQVSELKEAGWL